jgi:murein DD-endopeptidase MepM/ murein hydrolase activator NlpD
MFSDVEYTVKSGDTLSKIAKTFNVRLDDILYMNTIDDPNKIEVGQAILIPTTSSDQTYTEVAQTGTALVKQPKLKDTAPPVVRNAPSDVLGASTNFLLTNKWGLPYWAWLLGGVALIGGAVYFTTKTNGVVK